LSNGNQLKPACSTTLSQRQPNLPCASYLFARYVPRLLNATFPAPIRFACILTFTRQFEISDPESLDGRGFESNHRAGQLRFLCQQAQEIHVVGEATSWRLSASRARRLATLSRRRRLCKDTRSSNTMPPWLSPPYPVVARCAPRSYALI